MTVDINCTPMDSLMHGSNAHETQTRVCGGGGGGEGGHMQSQISSFSFELSSTRFSCL